jgi:hypothetical protein
MCDIGRKEHFVLPMAVLTIIVHKEASTMIIFALDYFNF